MGDENPIHTPRDYSKPSHEGYRNTIELLVWNNVLAIGLNVFQQDPSPHGRILLLVSLLNSFHRVGPQNSTMISRCSNNIMKNLYQKHGLVSRTYYKKSLIMTSTFGSNWNDPRDFAKPVKEIAFPQDVLSTSDCHLIELKNPVQCLMEAHLASTQPTQVNKFTTSCEICSGPHDTQYCMEGPEQAFVEYASSRTDKAVDTRLSKFEADFKQQQSEMTNKIDTVLKAITDQIAGALPSDKYGTQCSNHVQGLINTITIHSEKQSDSYDEKAKENEEEEKDSKKNIHVNPSTPLDSSVAFIIEKVLKFNSFFESLGLVPQSFNTEVIFTKGDDEEVMFIELIRKNDDNVLSYRVNYLIIKF
ncbi:hypothetical protein Tco_1346895 [Tanacetum coccineum]